MLRFPLERSQRTVVRICSRSFRSVCRALIATLFVLSCSAQTPDKIAPHIAKPNTKQAEAETEKNAAQIELLETKYRFESNGDSRKEVHARVRINNELGVRQFARLNFDFNRSFQTIEMPLVRITHASGGIADILPSAITDTPNPAVVDAPAYQDVRVKSVRILGLEPNDLLEYRVVTTTTHPALAPDFWLDHTFDRTGIVSREIFELDVPRARPVETHVNPATPAQSEETPGEDESERKAYKWDCNAAMLAAQSKDRAALEAQGGQEPDIVVTTFSSWPDLAKRLGASFRLALSSEVWSKAIKLAGASREPVSEQALYDLVSTKIRTIDLPLDFATFRPRPAELVLSSGYGTPAEKFELLQVLFLQDHLKYQLLLCGGAKAPENQLPRPSLFNGILLSATRSGANSILDPSLEVAPFGVIRSDFRGTKALLLGASQDHGLWTTILGDLPFPSFQRVNVDAVLASDGTLEARIHYLMRGENELLLRVAFHRTTKEKWKDVAQLLAISDGFRGQIGSVTASDPYATREPFKVEYQIIQPKFVDWSKKPVRIPALLPSPGLPDAASYSPADRSRKSIDLGTPLEIDLQASVKLPAGTSVQVPTGTSVERDYAKFSSQYSAQGNTFQAIRKLDFLLQEISTTRAGDLSAFLHAVQADQTQLFTLERSADKY
jgi:hypothetical protein